MVPEDYVHRIGRTGRAGIAGQGRLAGLRRRDEAPARDRTGARRADPDRGHPGLRARPLDPTRADPPWRPRPDHAGSAFRPAPELPPEPRPRRLRRRTTTLDRTGRPGRPGSSTVRAGSGPRWRPAVRWSRPSWRTPPRRWSAAATRRRATGNLHRAAARDRLPGRSRYQPGRGPRQGHPSGPVRPSRRTAVVAIRATAVRPRGPVATSRAGRVRCPASASAGRARGVPTGAEPSAHTGRLALT